MMVFLATAVMALGLFGAYLALTAPAHDSRGKGPKYEKRLASVYRWHNLPIGIRVRYPQRDYADGSMTPERFGCITKTEIKLPLGDPDGDCWIEITDDDGRVHSQRWAETPHWEIVP